jgi:DNA-binding transcriptional regulator YhcF (GntR family)
VWDDEIRLLRKVPGSDSADAQINQELREQAQKEALQALAALEKEMAAGHGKAVTRLAQELRQLVKAMGRRLDSDTEGKIHAVLAQAGELEGWQRWRADQLREKLVQQAEALLQLPAGQRLPSVRELAEHAGIAPMTVSSVYRELRLSGLIETRPGAGTYVGDGHRSDGLRSSAMRKLQRRLQGEAAVVAPPPSAADVIVISDSD